MLLNIQSANAIEVASSIEPVRQKDIMPNVTNAIMRQLAVLAR